MAMLRLCLFLAAAAGVGWAAVAAGERGAALIERLEAVRIEEARRVLDLGWLEIAQDGLRVTLSGTAPDPFARERALAALAGISPLATLRDETAAALPPPPNNVPLALSLIRDGDRVTLTGALHGKAMRDRLTGLIRALAPGLEIDAAVDLRGAQPPADWGPELQLAASAAALVPRARIAVSPGSVSVSGVVRDDTVRQTIEARLIDRAGSTVMLETALEVPPEVIAPFRFGAWKDAAGALRLIHCAGRSAAEAAEIDALLDRSGLADRPDRCRAGAGGPGGDWPGAIAAGLDLLSMLEAGQLSVLYRSVVLSVPRSMPEDARAGIEATLAAALPPGYDAAVRPAGVSDAAEGTTDPGAAPEPPRQPGAQWLHLVRAPSGYAVLSGRLPDRVRTAVEALATGTFGSDALRSAVRPAEGVAESDWSAALVAAVEAVGTLDAGEVAATPGRLTLRGRTTDAETAGALHRGLTQAMAGGTVRTEVSVDVPAAVAAIAPDAARCAHLANEAARGAIAFAPGSAVLEDDVRGTLDTLVRVLRRCREARLEVGGHTDSVGGAALNLRLSRARAEAVATALAARGIDRERLVSRGYGETRPVADNDTAEGRALNRRIAFRAVAEAGP